MIDNSVLKNRVRELRAQREMRQSDLAEEIGVTRQTILAIEKGRLNPSTGIALRLALALHEPVDRIFYLAPVDMAPGDRRLSVGAGTSDSDSRTVLV